MIELRMAADDLTRLRFAYSPLAEAISSLNMLHSGQPHPWHRRWAQDTRQRLHGQDTTLLQAIAPPGKITPTPPLDLTAAASIQHQLQLIARWPPARLQAELESTWHGRPMPAAARDLITDGPAGARRLAAALTAYWDTAIAPHWDSMRAALEADIAHRARHAAHGGITAMINNLHPQLRLDHSTIHLAKTFSTCNGTLHTSGKGILLMPSIFSGPDITLDPAALGIPAITYTPRGLAAIWHTSTSTSTPGQDPLSALIGKGRTAILRSTSLPKTTTDLARELHLSRATVSVHLTTLKRCGMLTSWRSGQRVFYQHTPLAASILTATSHPHTQH